MAETKALSRRDFLKVGGLIGLAAQVVTVPFKAYEAGADKETYTGWESLIGENTQFFNRKPFEITLEKLYTKFHPVDKSNVERADKYSEMAFNRVAQVSPIIQFVAAEAGLIEKDPNFGPMGGKVIATKTITENDMASIRPKIYEMLPHDDFRKHYDTWEERGQDRLVEDIRTVLLRTPVMDAARVEYSTYLALFKAYFDAFSDVDLSRYQPEGPAEESDYTLSRTSPFGSSKIDVREIVPATGKPGRMEFQSPEKASELIKKVAHEFGATLVGISRLNPDYVYSRGMRGLHAPMPGAPAAGEESEGDFLSDDEKAQITAALEGSEFKAAEIIELFEETKGDQAAMMAAFGEKGIDGMGLMGALQAGGLDPMAIGKGSTPAGDAPPAVPPLGSMSILAGDGEPFEVPEHWKYCIVMGVPHDWDQLLGAPNYAHSVDAYTVLDLASGRLASYLQRLGYAGRAEMPGFHYDILVPPHAVEAGIGEWGRNACVISPETGANLRLAAVITDLELAVDNPVDLNIGEFCKDCQICAEQCPTEAISFAASPEGMVSRGIEHWYINTSKCYGMWNIAIGTGCRLCIAVCPYSRKDNWVHGIARSIDPIDPTGLTNNFFIWMQKTFFTNPDREDYLAPPDGCYASYRPTADWLTSEKYLKNVHVNPQDMCKD